MNPRHRYLNAIRCKPVDRVPLDPFGLIYRDRKQIAEHPDPRHRKIAERVFPHTAYWWGTASLVNRYLVTPPQRMRSEDEQLANGNVRTVTTIDTPKGALTAVKQLDRRSRTSWTEKYPVESEADIERIASIPWELPEELAPPDLSKVPENFEDRGICMTLISSPFVCVAGMMRYQWFLELALTRSELMLELTEICRKRILDVLEVMLSKPGIEYVWIGGSEWVTPPMASPAVYDRFVQEQERSLITYIHDRSDAAVHVHCHGHVRHALKRMIERGVDYTEPVEPPPDGDITMAEAKAMSNGRIALGGNIECRIMCNEDEETVEQAVRDAFAGGKLGFLLRPTEGPTPRMSEREYRNYVRLVDLWEELS